MEVYSGGGKHACAAWERRSRGHGARRSLRGRSCSCSRGSPVVSGHGVEKVSELLQVSRRRYLVLFAHEFVHDDGFRDIQIDIG